MKQIIPLPSLCLAFGAFLASSADGQTTVWVDPVNGSNTQTGTQTAPFRTITHALTTGAPSQQLTIMLENGVYSAVSSVPSQPVESFPLLLRAGQHLVGVNECGAIIEHSVFALPPTPAIKVQADPLGWSTVSLFRDFEMRSLSNSGIRAEAFASESIDVMVDHVNVKSALKGIVVVANGGTTSLTMTDSDVTSTGTAVRVRCRNEGVSDVLLSNCVLRGGSGLHLWTSTAGSTLQSRATNTAIRNCINGIFTQKGSGTTITSIVDHCVFNKNGLPAVPSATGGGIVDASPRTSHTVENCIFWDQVSGRDMPNYNSLSYSLTTNLVQQASLLTAPGGNFSGDPLFVDAAASDYHLTQASPAIGTATVFGSTLDAEGDPRPSGGGAQNDVGLDEYYDTYVYSLRDEISIGTNATFRVFGPAGSTFQIYAGSPAAGAPGFSIPGVAQLAPGFFLLGSGSIPLGSGFATITVPVSNLPGLIGTALSLQAVLFNPSVAISYNVERVLFCN